MDTALSSGVNRTCTTQKGENRCSVGSFWTSLSLSLLCEKGLNRGLLKRLDQATLESNIAPILDSGHGRYQQDQECIYLHPLSTKIRPMRHSTKLINFLVSHRCSAKTCTPKNRFADLQGVSHQLVLACKVQLGRNHVR